MHLDITCEILQNNVGKMAEAEMDYRPGLLRRSTKHQAISSVASGG